MFRIPHLLIALCAVAAAPALAELDSRQIRMLESLPTPQAVIAAAPKQEDPIATSEMQRMALGFFSELAEKIAPKRSMEEALKYVGPYNGASQDLYNAEIKSLMGKRTGEAARKAAEQKLFELMLTVNSSQEERISIVRNLSQSLLTGETREFALDLLAAHLLERRRQAPANWLEAYAARLPDPLFGYAMRILSLPRTVWIGVLAVWLVLGIAMRTTPFQLVPGDQWLLQRGRKRRAMAQSSGIVADVQVIGRGQSFAHDQVLRNQIVGSKCSAASSGPRFSAVTRMHISSASNLAYSTVISK
jgi:hypothetical protein